MRDKRGKSAGEGSPTRDTVVGVQEEAALRAALQRTEHVNQQYGLDWHISSFACNESNDRLQYNETQIKILADLYPRLLAVDLIREIGYENAIRFAKNQGNDDDKNEEKGEKEDESDTVPAIDMSLWRKLAEFKDVLVRDFGFEEGTFSIGVWVLRCAHAYIGARVSLHVAKELQKTKTKVTEAEEEGASAENDTVTDSTQISDLVLAEERAYGIHMRGKHHGKEERVYLGELLTQFYSGNARYNIAVICSGGPVPKGQAARAFTFIVTNPKPWLQTASAMRLSAHFRTSAANANVSDKEEDEKEKKDEKECDGCPLDECAWYSVGLGACDTPFAVQSYTHEHMEDAARHALYAALRQPRMMASELMLAKQAAQLPVCTVSWTHGSCVARVLFLDVNHVNVACERNHRVARERLYFRENIPLLAHVLQLEREVCAGERNDGCVAAKVFAALGDTVCTFDPQIDNEALREHLVTLREKEHALTIQEGANVTDDDDDDEGETAETPFTRAIKAYDTNENTYTILVAAETGIITIDTENESGDDDDCVVERELSAVQQEIREITRVTGEFTLDTAAANEMVAKLCAKKKRSLMQIRNLLRDADNTVDRCTKARDRFQEILEMANATYAQVQAENENKNENENESNSIKNATNTSATNTRASGDSVETFDMLLIVRDIPPSVPVYVRVRFTPGVRNETLREMLMRIAGQYHTFAPDAETKARARSKWVDRCKQYEVDAREKTTATDNEDSKDADSNLTMSLRSNDSELTMSFHDGDTATISPSVIEE